MAENNQKVALVTGANKGIGFETAKQLAEKGFTVLLGARDETRGREAEAKLKNENLDVRFLHLDVDNPETHEAARKFIEGNFGKLDVLVNNAAIAIDEFKNGGTVPTSETPLDVYRQTFETNFFNLIALTNRLVPLVKKSEAGRIVNLSSVLGSLTLHSDPASDFYHYKVPAYDISKTALNAYTVHLAYELRDTPIKVNAAHPGYVSTDMNDHQGQMTVEDGAKTSVELATLQSDGFTGKFVHLGEELPW
jgi:NAD(P)-dependent dehydrogenase (short-subunit alcohol dehydrogenase family)